MPGWLYDFLDHDSVALAFCILAIASGIWEWIAWRRLRREPEASQMRRGCEILSVGAGTGSILLLAIPLLIVSLVSEAKLPGGERVLDVWIYLGVGVSALTLLASSFARRKLRIPGIIGGVTMLTLWWEMWVVVQWAESL